MKHGLTAIRDETLLHEEAKRDPKLVLYALESFAGSVDARIQGELMTRLILSHSAISRRLETTANELKKREAALNEAQHIAMLGRWDIDYANDARVWSRSLKEILEVDPDVMPSAKLFLSRVHPDDRKHIADLYRKLKETRGEWTFETRLLMDDGRIKWVHLRLQSEFDAEGRPIRGYGTLQDVTAMKEAEEKLERYSKHLEEMVSEQVQEISEAQMSTIFALVKLSESRDDDTGAHIERTASFCKLLAEKARLHAAFVGQIDDGFLEAIYKASPLHDIGKVGISDAILLKPGRLTKEEFEIMKTHVDIGYQTLLTIGRRYKNNAFLKMGLEITRYHHEKWDGSGYQQGLSGDEIPLSARIMAISDVYDALRSRRVYKEPYSHERSCAIMTESKGSHFDPRLVDIFLKTNAEFETLYNNLSGVGA